MPSDQGTRSTTTPHCGQSTRRRRVHEKHRHLPQRNELEPPRRQPVVPGPNLAAARTNRTAVGPRSDMDFNRRTLGVLDQVLFPEHEGLVPLDAIEDSLKLHPEVPPTDGFSITKPILPENPSGCTFFPLLRTAILSLAWRNGVGLCGDATRQGISRPGRVNLACRALAVQAVRAVLPIHLHSFALPSLRKSTVAPSFADSFYPRIPQKNRISTTPAASRSASRFGSPAASTGTSGNA